MSVAASDLEAVTAQLGRPVRGIVAVASRCPSGHPNVVKTEPRLPDGTPFPTLYYVTCPRLTGAIGTLEASGLMAEMTDRLAERRSAGRRLRPGPPRLPARARRAGSRRGDRRHLRRRHAARVKCLHVLVGHSLATGPGINPLGDETLELLGDWWTGSSCERP